MGTDFFLIGGLINFENANLSFGVITVCAICVLMLIANMLRRRIPFLRRSYMPTCVIAGLLGLVIKEIIVAATGFNIFHIETLNGLTYHLLSIGFIALCLRDKDDYQAEFDKEQNRIQKVNAFKSGSLIVSTYLVQGIVGIAITIILGITLMPEINKAIGIILPLGYGQGPGQASATGEIWDKLGIFADFGIEGIGSNFGKSIAAFGFLWASIPGVIMINRIAKRRGLKLNRNEYATSGEVLNQMVEDKDEVPLSESIDKFSLQVCMVGGVYLLTIFVIMGLEVVLNLIGMASMVSTIWGFNFMIAVLLALAARGVMRRMFRKGIMHRKYPNSYMMNRIGGAAFDISISTALASISLTLLGGLWVPLILISTAGGFVSIYFIRFFCRRIYRDYADEAFVAMYGMLTGTISNGMILVREIDPTFRTPAANDLVAGSSAAIVLGLPMLFLIAQAPVGNNVWWVLGIIIVYMLALITYELNWYSKIFRRRKAADKNVPLAHSDKDAQD